MGGFIVLALFYRNFIKPFINLNTIYLKRIIQPRMNHKKQLCAVIGIIFIGAILLFTTNPQKMPLPVLILPFILMFVLLWLLLRMLMRYFYPLTPKRKLDFFAALLSAFPVVCFLLQSVGQFSSRDFITLTALFVVLWFYLNRAITAQIHKLKLILLSC